MKRRIPVEGYLPWQLVEHGLLVVCETTTAPRVKVVAGRRKKEFRTPGRGCSRRPAKARNEENCRYGDADPLFPDGERRSMAQDEPAAGGAEDYESSGGEGRSGTSTRAPPNPERGTSGFPRTGGKGNLEALARTRFEMDLESVSRAKGGTLCAAPGNPVPKPRRVRVRGSPRKGNARMAATAPSSPRMVSRWGCR